MNGCCKDGEVCEREEVHYKSPGAQSIVQGGMFFMHESYRNGQDPAQPGFCMDIDARWKSLQYSLMLVPAPVD